MFLFVHFRPKSTTEAIFLVGQRSSRSLFVTDHYVNAIVEQWLLNTDVVYADGRSLIGFLLCHKSKVVVGVLELYQYASLVGPGLFHHKLAAVLDIDTLVEGALHAATAEVVDGRVVLCLRSGQQFVNARCRAIEVDVEGIGR